MTTTQASRIRALMAIVVPVLFGFGPCGPLAGTQLSGVEVVQRIQDFRFVNDVDHCALEVNPAKPHSVTVNCWAVGKQLYIGCKDCDGKTWSTLIHVNPQARIKIGEKVYPVKASRMQDKIAVSRAWKVSQGKYSDREATEIPEGYWLYHLGSKPSL